MLLLVKTVTLTHIFHLFQKIPKNSYSFQKWVIHYIYKNSKKISKKSSIKLPKKNNKQIIKNNTIKYMSIFIIWYYGNKK